MGCIHISGMKEFKDIYIFYFRKMKSSILTNYSGIQIVSEEVWSKSL